MAGTPRVTPRSTTSWPTPRAVYLEPGCPRGSGTAARRPGRRGLQPRRSRHRRPHWSERHPDKRRARADCRAQSRSGPLERILHHSGPSARVKVRPKDPGSRVARVAPSRKANGFRNWYWVSRTARAPLGILAPRRPRASSARRKVPLPPNRVRMWSCMRVTWAVMQPSSTPSPPTEPKPFPSQEGLNFEVESLVCVDTGCGPMTLPAFSQVKRLFCSTPKRDSNAPTTPLEGPSERHRRSLMAPHGPHMHPQVLTRQHPSARLVPSVAMQATERSPSFTGLVMTALGPRSRKHGQGSGARYEFFFMDARGSQLGARCSVLGVGCSGNSSLPPSGRRPAGTRARCRARPLATSRA